MTDASIIDEDCTPTSGWFVNPCLDLAQDQGRILEITPGKVAHSATFPGVISEHRPREETSGACPDLSGGHALSILMLFPVG
jgi:hypothetical protein